MHALCRADGDAQRGVDAGEGDVKPGARRQSRRRPLNAQRRTGKQSCSAGPFMFDINTSALGNLPSRGRASATVS